ncbi:MAG: fumarate reductase subunit C [Rhodospirillaceae bacterium]|nr:fumarate reductase subunit C [Rhodospirillaceae bacterium]
MSRKPYVREVPKFTWWLKKKFYTEYMLREATCIAVAIYSALLILGLIRLSEGPAEYTAYLLAMRSPLGIILQLIILAFALYHTITWFKLAPKGMPPIRIGDEKVEPKMIVAAHYAGWVGVSLVILLFVGLV